MKTAKITDCEFVKTWESRNGTMYTYSLELDNGDSGQINSKTENPPFLQVGETLNYASQQDKYGVKLTRIQPQDPNKPSAGAFKHGQNWQEDPDRQKMIVKQSSLNRAVEWHIANGGTLKDVIESADFFTEWVMK